MGFSHMAPIDSNGSHAAPSPRAPLGVMLSLGVCALLHASALRGEHTSALPSQGETRPLSILAPTPLALCTYG